MKTIRVGIIGTGSRGITCIGRQIVEQGRNLDMAITAFCNRTESRMEIARDELSEVARQNGTTEFAPKLYTDPDDLIKDDMVDLIVITSPTAAPSGSVSANASARGSSAKSPPGDSD